MQAISATNILPNLISVTHFHESVWKWLIVWVEESHIRNGTILNFVKWVAFMYIHMFLKSPVCSPLGLDHFGKTHGPAGYQRQSWNMFKKRRSFSVKCYEYGWFSISIHVLIHVVGNIRSFRFSPVPVALISLWPKNRVTQTLGDFMTLMHWIVTACSAIKQPRLPYRHSTTTIFKIPILSNGCPTFR